MSSVVSGGTAPTTYDNNNEANVAKLKQQPAVGAGVVGPPRRRPARPRPCARLHLNSLWSVWYGFFGTFLQAYTAVKCTKRFLRYSVLPWGSARALWELHACLAATGLAVVLLPLFLATAVFKVGNYANDGYKLGRGRARAGPGGRCAALWRHAGPTAATLHLAVAALLLAPRLVMEARLVHHGFLPPDALWRTDLDFMVVHHDRLVVLSFMTAASSPGGPNVTSTTPPGAHNHTAAGADAMALTGFNSSAPGVLEATVQRSLAQDVLDFLKNLLKMSDDDSHAIDSHIEPGFGSTVSVEYLNYAIALLVYSVRYPAVFWATNKCFATIFSIQLLANSIQSLLAFAGVSVLYKVQVVGAAKALPLLRHYPKGASPLGSDGTPFVLNPPVTLALFGLSSFLVLASSMILYLYGHARYNSFLCSYKERSAHITSQGGGGGWGYRTHGAALAALLASGVAHAPLLHDLTVVYRGSLDGAVLACVTATITTLFLWVVLWLGLTIKYRWTFKVTVTVARAAVRSARSVRLVTDVQLAAGPNTTQPLLVVGNGRAYTVAEPHSRKAIMSVVQKTQQNKQQQQQQQQQQQSNSSQSSTLTQSECPDDESDEQIYWLRPAGASPQRSPDSVSGGPLCWRGRSHSTHSSASTATSKKKHKVTFNEATSTSQRSSNKGLDGSGSGTGRAPGADEDDGDYATLRELPLLPGVHSLLIEDEEGKLLACVHDDNVTYASTSRDLIPPADYEDPSPLLTPEPLLDTTSGPKTNQVVTVHTAQLSAGTTPRCLRRADSGMPHEELTPRSDSVSTESSSSPPDALGSNHSETSSGVHSTASSEHQGVMAGAAASRRATSVADLQQQPPPDLWKSCSLQRNIPPPTSSSRLSHPPGAAAAAAAASSNTIYGETIAVKPGSSSSTPNQSGLYGYTSKPDASKAVYSKLPVQEVSEHGIPAVILETSGDNTVVIRRKATKPILDQQQIPVITEEPFSRSTNMKMTSFTEHSGGGGGGGGGVQVQVCAASATLPHYPTQPLQPQQYPHCSTMPLPHGAGAEVMPPPPAAPASCHVYPRRTQHATIPTHHNGVRLFTNQRVLHQPNNHEHVYYHYNHS